MEKKRNQKGFTLAELLIVVAIIAVLVAVAIPIFTKQLEKSRDAASVANMRSAYAEAQTCMLAGEDSGNADYNITNGSGTVTVSGVIIKSAQSNNWSDLSGDLPFTAPADSGTPGTVSMVFTYANDALSSVAFGS